MDNNTRFASKGSSPMITVKEKTLTSTCLPSKNGTYLFEQRKLPINTGPLYTMCSGEGARMLMNTESLATTNFQFLPPMRPKTTTPTFCVQSKIEIPKCPSSIIYVQSGDLAKNNALSTIISQKVYTSNGYISHQANQDKLVYVNNNHSSSSTRCTEPNKRNFNHSPVNQSSEGNTIVNSIKSFFSYLIKPIIDKTTMIVGNDTGKAATSTQNVWIEQDATSDKSNPNSATIFKHSSDSGFSSPNSNIYMKYMSDMENSMTFFDCDDYIEGGEDTVDFVADSTKEQHQWQPFEQKFFDKSTDHCQPSPKETIFYDCINQFTANGPTKPTEHMEETKSCEKIESEKQNKLNDKCIKKDFVVDEKIESKTLEKTAMQNPNSQRRKNKRKRKNRGGNRMAYRNKAMAPAKNLHEKQRHELDMNIHDDLNDCVLVDDDEFVSSAWKDDDVASDTDIEIIEIDTVPRDIGRVVPPKVGTSSPPKPKLPEPAARSPEKIPSGCIFTSFFRFELSNSCRKLRPMPLRFLQRTWQPTKSPQERVSAPRRTSETESDDSFIVFDDNCSKSPSVDELASRHVVLRKSYVRQRQISECSDDFICFESDTNDGDDIDSDETTDEDFTGKILTKTELIECSTCFTFHFPFQSFSI